MKNRVWAFAIPAVILLAVFLVPSLLTSQSKVMDKPSKEEVAHKMQSIQIPFVANNGQVDKQVKFYANTFGGTVFVTKDGEIVYSLPKSENSGVRSQESEYRSVGANCVRPMGVLYKIQTTTFVYLASCTKHPIFIVPTVFYQTFPITIDKTHKVLPLKRRLWVAEFRR